jgi:hypothetical protein
MKEGIANAANNVMLMLHNKQQKSKPPSITMLFSLFPCFLFGLSLIQCSQALTARWVSQTNNDQRHRSRIPSPTPAFCIVKRDSFDETRLCSSSSNSIDTDGETPKSGVEEELERLQAQLSWIEALEARNEAQLDSFVDEQDQWNSLEDEERILLESKESTTQRMEVLAEQLIQLWMGQKSMEG